MVRLVSPASDCPDNAHRDEPRALEPHHLEYLAQRAISEELAKASGLVSLTGEEAARALGRTDILPVGALGFPYPNIAPAYMRVRLDNAVNGAKYLVPASREVPKCVVDNWAYCGDPGSWHKPARFG